MIVGLNSLKNRLEEIETIKKKIEDTDLGVEE